MKIDLTDATFIIPIRIESEDRLRNVITSVAFLLNNFNTNIIVKEVDKTSVFKERALPQLESFFGDVNVSISLKRVINLYFIVREFLMK